MFLSYFENFVNQSLHGFLVQELLTEGAEWLLISIILKASWIICIASLLLTEGAEWLWPSGLLFRPFLADFASWDLACCSWGGRAYINNGRKGNKHINNGRKGSFELEIERSPSKQELCHFVAAPWRQSQPPRKVEGGWTEHTRAGNQEIWVILCSSGSRRYKTSKIL